MCENASADREFATGIRQVGVSIWGFILLPVTRRGGLVKG